MKQASARALGRPGSLLETSNTQSRSLPQTSRHSAQALFLKVVVLLHRDNIAEFVSALWHAIQTGRLKRKPKKIYNKGTKDRAKGVQQVQRSSQYNRSKDPAKVYNSTKIQQRPSRNI
ncbi:hypothetical protein E4U49_001739 [Claviceps purpurea]|nr:hypothetical protein E4U49_001739 [Claviceps purpurea]